MLDPAPSPAAVENSPLDRIFPLIIFDWDGTAVADRRSDARVLGAAMDRLLRSGAHLAVVTGTRFSHVDGALAGALRGPHVARLLVATNRGSELYGYDASGEPMLLARRLATPAEDEALDVAADRVAEAVRRATGLDVRVIRDRLNRRKIDLFPSWSDPPKARIAELVDAVEARLAGAGWRGGVAEVVRRARVEGVACGLPEPRVTSDGKHVEIGLTDKADAVDAVTAWLGEPAQGVLLVGDEVGAVGGVDGSDAQAERRAVGGADVSAGLAPPVAPTEDPTRRIVEDGLQLVREHEIEACFTVGNGAAGVRGSISEGTPNSAPGTRVAGAWLRATPESLPTLARTPEWTRLRIRVGDADLEMVEGTDGHRRVLDLAQGMYWRTWRHVGDDGRVTLLRVARFASMADRRLLGERVELTTENWGGPLEVEARVSEGDCWTRTGPITWTGPARCAIGLAFHGTPSPADTLDGPGTPIRPVADAPPPLAAAEPLPAPETPGAAPGLEPAHPLARWRVVTRPGATWRLDRAHAFARRPVEEDACAPDPSADTSALLALAERTVERGLDHAVADHVVACRTRVDALAVTLEGDAPLQRALAMGYRGALYAWESAGSGDDVTPPTVRMPDGREARVFAGEREHHVSAAVAWAAWHYWSWTGDDAYLRDAGAEVILETARFWASRGRMEADGRFHIRHVVGPDEYHDDVDDNAYTNGMAAWNLQRSAEVARRMARAWPERWAALAAALALTPDGPTLAPRMPPWLRRLSFPFVWRERRFRAEIDAGRARLVPEGAW